MEVNHSSENKIHPERGRGVLNGHPQTLHVFIMTETQRRRRKVDGQASGRNVLLMSDCSPPQLLL